MRLRSILCEKLAFRHNVSNFSLSSLSGKLDAAFLKGFSTVGTKEENSFVKGYSRSSLLRELETSLRKHQVKDAWKTYKDFKNIYGYPDQCIVTDLITESSYSDDRKSLQWASNLVVSLSREKSVLLKPEAVTKLALSLARAQIPVSAASVLRVTLEKRSLPSLDVLRMIFLHLVKTKIGVCLASNFLGEFFYILQKLNANESAKLVKPDTTIFNLVLDACVSFGTPFKGQQTVELMALVGQIADLHTAAIIARIYEMSGMRDALKKFSVLLNTVPRTWDVLYQQYYDSLLGLHFKFNDIDSISNLLINLSGDHDLRPCQNFEIEKLKPFAVSIGSESSKMGLRLQFLLEKPHSDYIYKVESKRELILHKDGKVVLSKKGLAKLITAYQKSGRIIELSKLLVSIRNMVSSPNSSPCFDVIDACIYLGWLETAHDILLDLEAEKCHVSENSYAHLLAAYRNKKMFREATALERQLNRTTHCELSSFGDNWSAIEKILCRDLAKAIILTMKEEDDPVTSSIYEYNSSIYFFSKARMMEDANQVYRKMQKLRIHPNATTFFHLTCGYSSLEAYREITFVWGDIKRSMQNHNTVRQGLVRAIVDEYDSRRLFREGHGDHWLDEREQNVSGQGNVQGRVLEVPQESLPEVECWRLRR